MAIVITDWLIPEGFHVFHETEWFYLGCHYPDMGGTLLLAWIKRNGHCYNTKKINGDWPESERFPDGDLKEVKTFTY